MATYKYSDWTFGQVEALLNILGGEKTAREILSGTVKVNTERVSSPAFLRLTLGTLKTADDYRKAITAAGMKIGDWTKDIMSKPEFKIAETQTELELVRVSVGDLGFNKPARYDEICARAKELGLDLCPPEVGPALRLAYKDQPMNEWLRIAMESIRGSDGYLLVFYVGRDGDGLWLGADYGYPDYVWGPGSGFVFARRIGTRP